MVSTFSAGAFHGHVPEPDFRAAAATLLPNRVGLILRPRSARSISGRPRSFSRRLIWVTSVDW